MEKEREIYRTLYLGHFKDIQEENARLKKAYARLKKAFDEMDKLIDGFYETLGRARPEETHLREFANKRSILLPSLEYSPKKRKNEKGSDTDTGGDDKRPKTG